MNYGKPEVTPIGSALTAIQHTGKCGAQSDAGDPSFPLTPNAYEADE